MSISGWQLFTFIRELCIIQKIKRGYLAVGTYSARKTLGIFGEPHKPTHLGIRTHTSSVRRWATLANGFKLKATVKVTITLSLDLKQHRCAKPGCHAHWRLWQSEPTSPSLFKPLTSANTHYFKHICPKDHYSHVLIHTMLIFDSTHYTISTEPLM